jgi:acyl-CoA synthetase (AMP-forming)/AMP-acid ligase II
MTRLLLSPHITNVGNVLQEAVQTRPNEPVYTFTTNYGRDVSTIKYAELHEQARKIGYTLYRKGYQGQRVLLLYAPGLEYIVAFWGCLYAGVIAVPVYPPAINRPMDRIEAIIEDAKPVAAMTTSVFLKLLTQHFAQNLRFQHIECIATDILSPLESTVAWQTANVRSEDIAFLQYTSGSTAKPKGVMVTHHNLLCNEQIIYEAFDHSPNTIVAGWLPFYHDMGLIGNILQPLFLGGHCILTSPFDFLKQPVSWLKMISDYQATSSGGPNFAYELCIRKIRPEQIETLDLSSWRVAFNGAETIRSSTIKRFTEKFSFCGFRPEVFFPCYGLAEATLFVTGCPVDQKPTYCLVDESELQQNRVRLVSEGTKGVQELVGSGRVWGDTQVNIVNPTTSELCETNEIGEIWVSGDSITSGYWQQESLSRETFRAIIGNNGQNTFLRTGDLGFIHDGELFVTGRIKDLIIIDGRNHYPQDIEYTIEKNHIMLKEGGVAVFSADVADQECVVVIARIRDKNVMSSQEIVSSIKKTVANAHQIRLHDVILLTQGNIPKTSSGKIQRYLCREMYLSGDYTTY